MAELLARGYITIAAVSDGYSLSLTAASVSIPANHDGSNPDLEYAETTVTLQKGNDAVAFDVVNVIPSSDGIRYTYKNAGECAWRVAIIGLDSSISSGYLDIQVRTKDGKFESSIKFSFSVVKNTVGVDWIEEWDGTHNQIGENYVVTPKLFAGHKSNDGKITGVYLGKLKGFIGEVFPFTLADAEEGIYGYRDNKIVFYINNYGAKIGGWDITPGSIQCEDGTLTIKSEGTISSQSDDKTHWSLNKDGSASFANGKVLMNADGSASFEGKITAASGSIAGWAINNDSLFKGGLSLNTKNRFFAIANTVEDLTSGSLQLDKVKTVGGVAMFYTSDADYGFIAYKGDKLMFSVGTNNNIAGWTFDENSIYIGEKNNNVDQYTSDADSLTIGTNGMRGKSWYINTNGSASFSSGYAKFKEKSGSIGSWNFDSDSFYTGTKNNVSGQFTNNTSSITLGPKGLRGYKWRLDTDGAGALAGGNIKWDAAGNVTFGASVVLNWSTGINEAKDAAKTANDNAGAAQTSANNAQASANNAMIAAKNAQSTANSATSSASTANKNAITAQDKANYNAKYSEMLSMETFGQMLYRDPEFTDAVSETDSTKYNYNGTRLYLEWNQKNSSGTVTDTNVTRSMYTDSTAPNSTHKVMRFVDSKWYSPDDHRLCGFFFANQTRANAKFMVRIVAKIPTGWQINNYHNAYGNGGTTEWLTSQKGTGQYETYICVVKCGSSGTFSTINHFALTAVNPTVSKNNDTDRAIRVHNVDSKGNTLNTYVTYANVNWYVAYCTVFDGTSSDKSTTKIDKNGIYTGTLSADQIITGTLAAGLLAAGCITSEKLAANSVTAGKIKAGCITSDLLNADSIKSNIINTSYINGLTLTFDKGTIGGWSIGSNSISKNSVTLGSDGTISNGSYWSLKKDGSGTLAKGNISWTNEGTLSVVGKINATSGNIGKWYILDGVITSDSTGSATNYVKLDSTNRKITLQTSGSSYNDGNYDYVLNSDFGAILTLDGNNGIIKACAKNSPNYSTATSYLSSNGVFSNIAGINGMPASSGYTQRGAIVGLGFANVNKNTWQINEDETVVAGVYGRAINSGTAAAYGGFFYQLKACGLTTSVYYFTDSNDGKQLSLDKTTVIGLINSKKTNTIYLPKNAHEGQEVEIIQMGAGVTRIDTNDGTHIYDDTSENEYYDCPEGWVTICKRVRYAINNVTYDIWAVHQYKFK